MLRIWLRKIAILAVPAPDMGQNIPHKAWSLSHHLPYQLTRQGRFSHSQTAMKKRVLLLSFSETNSAHHRPCCFWDRFCTRGAGVGPLRRLRLRNSHKSYWVYQ
eukprot:2619374-Rhodomonas_salina.1